MAQGFTDSKGKFRPVDSGSGLKSNQVLTKKDIVHIDNSLQDAQIMVDRLPQNSTSKLAIQKIKEARRKLNGVN